VDAIFGVLTVVSISIKALLDATPCSLVDKVTKLWEEPVTTIIHPENGQQIPPQGLYHSNKLPGLTSKSQEFL
jgi:hypothetical protein